VGQRSIVLNHRTPNEADWAQVTDRLGWNVPSAEPCAVRAADRALVAHTGGRFPIVSATVSRGDGWVVAGGRGRSCGSVCSAR
jgi:hypothetical protein